MNLIDPLEVACSICAALRHEHCDPECYGPGTLHPERHRGAEFAVQCELEEFLNGHPILKQLSDLDFYQFAAELLAWMKDTSRRSESH